MNGKNRTILLVEDEMIIALAQAETVRSFGYEVVIAESGEEAVRIMTGDSGISLVLMDIDLGDGLDGPHAAQQILAKRNIPIVFLTSHSEREMVEKVRGITRYGYVIKNSGDFVLQSSIEMAFELFEAHQKSSESEEKYRRLHETMMDAFVNVDMSGVILETNHSYEAMLGYTSEELRRLTYRDVTPEKWHSFESNIVTEQILVHGYSDVYEKEYIRKDGTIFPVELRTFLVKDREDKAVSMWAIVRDITDRKLAEEAVRKANLHISNILESISDAFFALDEELVVTYFNQAAERLLGRKSRDVLGRRLFDAFPEARGSVFEVNYREAIIDRQPRMFEVYFDIDPYRNWYEVHVYPQERGISVYFQVTTERKRSEVARRESDERLRFAMEMSNIGVWDLDLADHSAYRSFMHDRIFGYADLLPAWNYEMFLEHVVPEDRAMVDLKFQHAIEARSEWNFECRIRRADGEVRWIWAVGRHQLDGTGAVRRMSGIIQDITGLKQAEEQIKNLLAEKELLLKEVHHRIKNSINIMMSLLSLQANELKDPGAVEALQEAIGRMRSMGVLYDRLYQSEGLREMSIRGYLPSLAAVIAANFPNRDSVRIVTEIDDFIIDMKLLSPLGIIINELITNAMKYAFPGRDDGLITISASVRDNRATLIIEDNGIGLPESVDMDAACGLGLKLVTLLTRQIKGTLMVERKQGTRFVLEFDV